MLLPGMGPLLTVFPSLQVFLENLQHEDAFVYLSAIQGERCPAGANAGAFQERVLCWGVWAVKAESSRAVAGLGLGVLCGGCASRYEVPFP